MIKNYTEGSDITILNTLYNRPKKDIETEKWDKGSITIIFRDNITGVKHHQTIKNPDYEFYYVKPDVKINHQMLFIDKDKVDKHVVPYINLEKSIAKLTGNLDFYYDNIKMGNRGANRELHTHPRVFNSDTNIEEHYRYRFDKMYTNESFPITKSYFDIEADTIDMKGDFPEMGECPINAVTIINEFVNKTYTFLLRNPENPLIEEFEKSINEDTFVELKEFIKKRVGGWKNEIRFGLDKMEYEFLFYDDEIKMLQELFILINITQPDFVLAWNMAFDIPYIIERIRILGYNPEDILCHPDFEIKNCLYYIDERNKEKPAEKGDYAKISSYTVYIDQLVQFASRRKSKINSYDNKTLDYIGEVITGVRKLDYSHITTRIAELPWKDYKIFVFYNIMDTIVQKCIECKVNDIDYTFNKCLINNTRYAKCHRQTVYLVNRGCKEFSNKGLIICNNNNKKNVKEPFPGAFVADPNKLNDYSKYKINGKVSLNIYDNGDDFDYKSLYPSEIREFNMAPNTQIGKIFIPNQIFKKENEFNSEIFDRGGLFLEQLQSGVYLEFCKNWFNLADYKSLYKDTLYYLNYVKLSSHQLILYTRDGHIMPIRRTNGLNLNPIYRNNDRKVLNRFYKTPDYNLIKNIKVEDVIYNG